MFKEHRKRMRDSLRKLLMIRRRSCRSLIFLIISEAWFLVRPLPECDGWLLSVKAGVLQFPRASQTFCINIIRHSAVSPSSRLLPQILHESQQELLRFYKAQQTLGYSPPVPMTCSVVLSRRSHAQNLTHVVLLKNYTT